MKTKEDKKKSILLEDFPVEDSRYIDDKLIEKWNKIFDIKESFAKDIENARAEKKIGSALDCKITIYTNGDEYNFIEENKENIALASIVSELEVINSNEKKIEVEKSSGTKCPRCWTYSKDFSDEGICMKCKENM